MKGKYLAGQGEGEGGKYLENTELILGFSIMVILTKKKVATLRGSNYWRVWWSLWWQTELTGLVRIESLLDFKDYHSSVLTGGLT